MAQTDPRVVHAGARLALLVNPVARRTGDTRWIDDASRALRARYVVDLVAPSDPGAIESAARAAAASHDGVIVLGGDGTLNRVVNGLDGQDVPVGILPLGTGNDFARAMGIPSSPVEAAGRILNGRIRRVDLPAVNGRSFCTAGLLGLPADAALSVDRWTRPSSWTRPVARRLGGATYRLAGLKHLVLQGGTTLVLHVRGGDEPRRPVETHGVFVANTRVLGGGLVLPLDADDSDGRTEVAFIPRMPRVRLWWAFACFAQGWRVPAGTLDIVRAARFEIVAEHALPFTADGDLICRDTQFDITVRPGGLSVIC